MANIGGHIYISPVVNLKVSSATAGWVDYFSKAIFYKTSNGIWYMHFDLNGGLTSGTTVTINIAGVNIRNANYGGSGGASGASTPIACALSSATQIRGNWTTGATSYYMTGDFELLDKPTAYLPDGV